MLEQELIKYTSIREELLLENPKGGYVVIMGNVYLGIYPNSDEALTAGLKEYGDVQFLVKSIIERTRVITFSARG